MTGRTRVILSVPKESIKSVEINSSESYTAVKDENGTFRIGTDSTEDIE